MNLRALDISNLNVKTLSKSKENVLLQLGVKMNLTKKVSPKRKMRLPYVEHAGWNHLTVHMCPDNQTMKTVHVKHISILPLL